jgi:hypothetical protein
MHTLRGRLTAGLMAKAGRVDHGAGQSQQGVQGSRKVTAAAFGQVEDVQTAAGEDLWARVIHDEYDMGAHA